MFIPDARGIRPRRVVAAVSRTGLSLVLLATTMQTPDIHWLMGKVQTLEFYCYDGMQWRNTWDTSAGDTNLPVAVRVRIQLAPRPGEEASKAAQPLEMVVPLASQTRTSLTAGGTQ